MQNEMTYRQFVIRNLRARHADMTILQADQEYAQIYRKCARIAHFSKGIHPTIRVIHHGMSVTVQMWGVDYHQGTSRSIRTAYRMALWHKRFMAHSAEERETFYWDHIGESMPNYVQFVGGMHPL